MSQLRSREREYPWRIRSIAYSRRHDHLRDGGQGIGFGGPNGGRGGGEGIACKTSTVGNRNRGLFTLLFLL